MLERLVQCRLARAERLRGDSHASAVEGAKDDTEPVARRAEQRVRIDAHVAQLEIHAAETAHAQRIGCRDALEPGVSIGTRNALMPRPRIPGCVAANTNTRSAAAALATQTFRPLIT